MKTIVFLARIIAIFIIALFILRFVAFAQQPMPQADMNIDAATRTAIVDGIVKELNDSYIFLEMAKKMEADLRARQSSKEYDSLVSARAFAEKLTKDLQAISKDKHIRVRFSEQVIPVRKKRTEPTAEEKAEGEWFNKRINFGFEKIERMNGNIGYIDLRGFNDAEAGAATVAAAMNFVNNTEALIFDLRENGGGSPQMVALICSYLFGDKPVHLNDLYWRKDNITEEFWTKPVVAGKKFLDKDVYILTSNRTFSGAEEFSYNLKNLKRATIIGETTGGGAHPGGPVRLTDHFRINIPSGRAVSPITKTNWEGTGVVPDINAQKEQALKIAYLMALKKSVDSIKDENVKAGVIQLIEQTQKELDEIKAKK